MKAKLGIDPRTATLCVMIPVDEYRAIRELAISSDADNVTMFGELVCACDACKVVHAIAKADPGTEIDLRG